MDIKKGGFMKFNYRLLIFWSFLTINSIVFTSTKSGSKEESLKQVLSFINEKSGQTSPVFDLSVKPHFDHVNAALERVIQKAADDKAFNPDQASDDTELTAHQQQNILEGLYQSNPNLFLSAADLEKETKLARRSPATQERHIQEQPTDLTMPDSQAPFAYAPESTTEYYDTASENETWNNEVSQTPYENDSDNTTSSASSYEEPGYAYDDYNYSSEEEAESAL